MMRSSRERDFGNELSFAPDALIGLNSPGDRKWNPQASILLPPSVIAGGPASFQAEPFRRRDVHRVVAHELPDSLSRMTPASR